MLANMGKRDCSYHDQHQRYQSQTAWTSSAQQLVITTSTCTCQDKGVNQDTVQCYKKGKRKKQVS